METLTFVDISGNWSYLSRPVLFRLIARLSLNNPHRLLQVLADRITPLVGWEQRGMPFSAGTSNVRITCECGKGHECPGESTTHLLRAWGLGADSQ